MLATTLERRIKNFLPKPLIEALSYLRHFNQKLPNYEIYESHVAGKHGIEIGGPSLLFKTILPLYQKIGDLDGVNFSHHTVWEGSIQPGRSYSYTRNKHGLQYICEAANLSQIESNKYDFLLSSNCLEHIANPLKALIEWKRIMRPGGALILILPNKVSNFDHKRPYTSFDHILDDFKNETTEHDLTHLDEILALHDLSRDLPAGDFEQFKKRSLDNFNNRTLHHHVFNLELITKILDFLEFEIVDKNETNKDFFVLALNKG